MRFMMIALAALALLAPPAQAAARGAYELSVLVNGDECPEYDQGSVVYVEALRGREYALRLTNPTPYRVAVALSVDGLNTIDAKHSDAWSASKWVLDPYESTQISGWQVSNRSARRFFFTGENRSYAAKLGQTKNLGVIEAVFYRERPSIAEGWDFYDPDHVLQDSARAEGAPAPSAAAPKSAAKKGLSDDYAATGMGDRTGHRVYRVEVDLDPQPVASVRIRYEFRPQLVKLGILPPYPSPLGRREQARGFEAYCPEP